MSDKNTNDINDITDGISETVPEADETLPTDDVSSDNKNKKKNKNNKKSGKPKKQSSLAENRFLRILKLKRVWIPLALVLTVVIAYLTFIFAPFRPISTWRKLYIETAMTTGDHQWLATMLLPKWLIEKEFTPPEQNKDIVGAKDKLLTRDEYEKIQKLESENDKQTDTDKTDSRDDGRTDDILGQKKLQVGKPDMAGNIVSVNDIKEGIVISDIEKDGDLGKFRGKVMLIDDPSRVYIGTTPYKHETGLRIKDMMKHHGAVAGINASGFNDPNDEGHGGDVIGITCSNGEFWGTPVTYYGSVIMTKDDNLVVGNVKNWQNYAIREGIQFGPVLIADGKPQFDESNPSGGFGHHPRTAIGQRADGVIVFLIIDGRKLGWSTGCMMKDLVDILLDYGVVNAACCDGGSSSVMAYKGEVITKNSSANPDYGRRLPNAWLVRPKESAND